MKKLRTFYNTWDGEDVVAFTSEQEAKEWAELSKVKEIFRAREIDPMFDALVLEMVEVIDFYACVFNWESPQVINDPDFKAQKMKAKYDAYMRRDKDEA